VCAWCVCVAFVGVVNSYGGDRAQDESAAQAVWVLNAHQRRKDFVYILKACVVVTHAGVFPSVRVRLQMRVWLVTVH
jgi:hypothetical protein